MITIEKLNAFGADTSEGLARCYGNEALYIKLVKMIPAEKNFDLLKQSLDEGNLDAAFEAAHGLKGVLGNLSLTEMYDKCSQMTELLRARTQTDYSGMLAGLLDMRDKLAALCEE